jgi:hypothetical protein
VAIEDSGSSIVGVWTEGVSGAGRGKSPIACSKEGGGERGRSVAVSEVFSRAEDAGCVDEGFESKAGGSRLDEDVGNGKAGGGSEVSGTSTSSISSVFHAREHTNLPSQTFVRRILAPRATPNARPSSLVLTVSRLRNVPSSRTTRLRLLSATLRSLSFVAAVGGAADCVGSDSIICPKWPKDIILGFACPTSLNLSELLWRVAISLRRPAGKATG